MRVFLTKSDLDTEAGKQLLELSVRIATDGKLELAEIKELRDDGRGHPSFPAQPFPQLAKVDEFMHIGRRMRGIALQSAMGGMAISFVGILIASAG